MDVERLRKIEQLFEKALELPPEEREAFLEQACGADDELRKELASLLEAHDRAGEFMEQPVTPRGEIDRLRAEHSDPDRGQLVGHYKLLRKIGEGGMSEVHMAVRADDEFQKRVAVKIIIPGRDREDLLRRFRTERQILAGLDHPNIAKLLDGGTTRRGRPYFVMDYIDGVPIDQYCDRNRLSIRERLELFRTVCAAVQYAHQNLVVHRDLKASNILVTSDGTPKLLDFGIAKLLKPDQFAHEVEYTATWLRPMTPRYASPEQVQGKLVGTPSDVYSLGVLLYRLLTGHFPYPMEGQSPTELARLVVETEPEPPSLAVGRPEQLPGRDGAPPPTSITPESVSRERRTQPQALRRQLTGDLDNIVLMALRKEPQRRYSSVEQFSEDIRRHLAGLPVLARKDTMGYRATKFLRRNRVAVAAAAAFLVVLIGFSITMTVLAARIAHERDQARLERDRSKQVVGFLRRIFEVSDPIEAQGEEITAREILERGAQRVPQELEAQPEVQATLLDSIGNVYRSLALYDRAQELLEEALTIRREVLGPDHPDTAQSLHSLGVLLRFRGDYAGAQSRLEQALEVRQARLGPDDPATVETLYEMAKLLQHKGEYKDSKPLYEEALRRQRAISGGEQTLADMETYYGILLIQTGDFSGGESLMRDALEVRRRLFGPKHMLVAESLNDLGVVLGLRGDYTTAEAMLREALPLRRAALGNDHPSVAETVNNLGWLLKMQGEYAEAEQLYREGLRMERERLGDDHPIVGTLTHNLGRLLHEKGDYATAEPIAREAVRIRRKSLGDGHAESGASMIALGNVLVETQGPQDAEPWLRRGVATLQGALPEDHWRIWEGLGWLGYCLARDGQFEEAEPLLVQGYEGLRDTRGAEHKRTRVALSHLVEFHETRGNAEAAAEYRALLPKAVPVHAD